MSDAPGPTAAQHDAARHTLTVRDVETLLAKSGIQRSHRHVLRLCQSGLFDAVKVPGGPNGEEWYVAPESVPKAIGDLKAIDAARARRTAPEHGASQSDAPEITNNNDSDTPRSSATQHGVSREENNDGRGETHHDTAGRATTDHDIYEHPYVKKLEAQVEKLEAKYDAQVRRTEEIQTGHQAQLIELQRMTTVGNSQTLADFMLKAREWVLGRGNEAGNSEPAPSSTP
jgi:hypothetical protein